MTDPVTGLPVEAIRFGSTTESAKAISAWLKQTDPTTTVRLEIQPTTSILLVFTSSGNFILSHGDYLVMEDGLPYHYTSGGFAIQYGAEQAQPLESEAGGLDTPVEEVVDVIEPEELPTEA